MNPYGAYPAYKALSKGAFDWMGLLTNSSKVLGVINQAIPVFYQAGPIFKNAKTMFKIANEFKGSDKKTTSKSSSDRNVNRNNNSNINRNNNSSVNANVNTNRNDVPVNTEKRSETITYNNAPTFFL